MRVDLGHVRGVGGHRCAEIAEAGRREDAKAAGDEGLADFEALVETTCKAVNDKESRARSPERKFDRAATRVDDLASAGDAVTRSANVVGVLPVNACGQRKQQNANDGD